MPESSKRLNRNLWIPGLRYASPGMTNKSEPPWLITLRSLRLGESFSFSIETRQIGAITDNCKPCVSKTGLSCRIRELAAAV